MSDLLDQLMRQAALLEEARRVREAMGPCMRVCRECSGALEFVVGGDPPVLLEGTYQHTRAEREQQQHIRAEREKRSEDAHICPLLDLLIWTEDTCGLD